MKRLVVDLSLEQRLAEHSNDGATHRNELGEELCWTPDSKWIISGSTNGDIHMWDMAPPPGKSRLDPADYTSATVVPNVTLPGASRGASRAVRFHPRLCEMAVGGDDLVSVHCLQWGRAELIDILVTKQR